jgi:hypothetical protein
MRFGSSSQSPIGVIHTGPIYTLHLPDGTPATHDVYWYEPDYPGDQKLHAPTKDQWREVEKHRKWALGRMENLAYRTDLERLLIRYAGALDHANLDVAFLQLWSILERLTDTVGANYDATIRRTTWPYPDRCVAKEQLEVLRFRRNELVHAAKSGQHRDQFVYLTKNFVDPHLLALIRNDYDVDSLEEYGRCLDLSTDLPTLEKQRRHLDRALRFLKKRK